MRLLWATFHPNWGGLHDKMHLAGLIGMMVEKKWSTVRLPFFLGSQPISLHEGVIKRGFIFFLSTVVVIFFFCRMYFGLGQRVIEVWHIGRRVVLESLIKYGS